MTTPAQDAAVWRALDRIQPDRVTIVNHPTPDGIPHYCADIWSDATDGYVSGYGPDSTDAVRQALRNAGIAIDDEETTMSTHNDPFRAWLVGHIANLDRIAREYSDADVRRKCQGAELILAECDRKRARTVGDGETARTVPPPAPGAMYPVHREPIRRDDADHADAPGDPDAPQPDWHDVATWSDSAASHLRRAALLLEQLGDRGAPFASDLPAGDDTVAELRALERALMTEHGYACGRRDAKDAAVTSARETLNAEGVGV